MKFTIDLQEGWVESEDGELNLQKEVQDYIVRDVIRQINDGVKKQVQIMASIQIKKAIEEGLETRIQVIIESFIQNGKVKNRDSGEEFIGIPEYVQQTFDNAFFRRHNSLTEKIQEMGKKHADEIKNRYDLLFASQVVAKLKDSGLLNEEVSKLLMQSLNS